jgi:hypothetical protein
MVHLSKSNLNDIADKLISELSVNAYVQKTIKGDFVADDGRIIEYDFIICAVLYRNGDGKLIDIVPVWWEFRTYNETNMEEINDFLFSDVKNRIKFYK